MGREYKIISIFIPFLGCPFHCIYCNQPKITGQKEEIIDAEYVDSLINNSLKTMPSNSRKEIAFYGGTFTGLPLTYQKELLWIAKKYKDKGDIHAIRISTRPDFIDNLILTNLKVMGVDTIELGVQSMSDEVLKESLRGYTSEDVVKSVSLIKQYSFKLGLQIMFGLPKDNVERMNYTIDKIIDLKPDFVRLYPTLVIRNTKLEELFLKGEYKPLTLKEAIDICKVAMVKFIKNGIKVIRIGLQASDNINTGKDIVAGPFHPSFGEMVESSLIFDMLSQTMKAYNINDQKVIIKSNPRMFSAVIGNKRRNILKLKELYNIDISLKGQDELDKEQLVIITKDNEIKITKKDFINNLTLEGIFNLI